MSTMADNQINYNEIRGRVEERLKARKDLQDGAVIMVFWVAIAWTVCLLAVPPGIPSWPVILLAVLTVLAVLGFMCVAVEVYYRAPARERERDRLIEREIDRERARLYDAAALEKPKRDQAARLA